MTNEDAIKMLKSKLDGTVDTSYEWCECVRMAIKALEQEPCEDCISREKTIEKFCDYVGGGMSMDDFDALFDIVVKMPSVQPKTDVLDKIRAEIRKLDDINPDYPMDKTIHISRNEVLQIIDKYRQEGICDTM